MSAISGKAEDDHATTTDQTDNGGQNVQVDSSITCFSSTLCTFASLNDSPCNLAQQGSALLRASWATRALLG